MPWKSKLDRSPEIDPEFLAYEQNLITGQLHTIEEKIVQAQQQNPEFKTLSMEKLREVSKVDGHFTT